MADFETISKNLINGRLDEVKSAVQAALDEGASPQDVLQKGLIAGMEVVGYRFKNNIFYVPEVLIAARAMHGGMDILKPRLAESGVEPVGKVAFGTVKGDLHDIGKNLVVMMLEGSGFEINDLGIDVPPEKFIEAAKGGSEILCMSALLTTTMPWMKTTIEALKEAGVTDNIKTMVGGAPLTQNYADEIGADGYAPDAASAVDVAKELIGK